MVSRALFFLGPMWIHVMIQACRGDELSREELLSWVRGWVLDGLGLEEPPLRTPQSPDGEKMRRAPLRTLRTVRRSRMAWVSHQSREDQETSDIILFPNPDSSCATSDSLAAQTTDSFNFTYYFQPSVNQRELLVTSAHFWFFEGGGAAASTPTSTSTQLFLQQLLQASSETSSDGWTTYHLDPNLLSPIPKGPFLLQVSCPACHCYADEPGKTPFLRLFAQPRGLVGRSPRSAPFTIPWSPSALDLLQRPSQDRPQQIDCHRAQIQIRFEELGWDNWIVHPKVLMFAYCHGNCSAGDRTAATLGITQCCAPVPGTMKSLRITTTSDGGYSFKYETLPNIIPEECACM